MSAFGGAPDLEQVARTSSSATNADRAAVLAARKERRAAAKAAKQDKPRPRRGPTREGRGGEARPRPSAAEYAAAVARGAAAGAWRDVVRTLERMRRDGVAPVAGVYRALDRARRRGEDNDAMRFLFAETPRPLDIVFEDGEVLVVNKPSGVVVQPGRSWAFWSGTLAHAVMAHCCRDEGPADDWRPGVVHRLDKETSGLVVLAKTALAARSLRAEFAARGVKRVYLALLHGSPLETEGRVETHIAPDPTLRRMAALPLDGEGAYAASRYRCIEKLEEYSVVEFRLETGKTHQVRVHALYLGCPLAGDATYGGAGPLDPFLLHAGGLGFVHPRSRELLAFEAGLPPHFERVFVKLRRDV